MANFKGTRPTVWVDGVEIPVAEYVTFVPERVPDDLREKWQAMYLGPAKHEISISAFSIDPEALEAFMQTVTALDVVDISMWPDTTRWFFPEFRGQAKFVSIEELGDGATQLSGEFDKTPEIHFRNRLAPIVYWLWRYPWRPVRMLSWSIRQWCKSKRQEES